MLVMVGEIRGIYRQLWSLQGTTAAEYVDYGPNLSVPGDNEEEYPHHNKKSKGNCQGDALGGDPAMA
jgi:hypothetical protein